MANLIRFVQLESSAFLTDPDFMLMDCRQRGVYCTLIFLLYCNDGKLKVNSNRDGTPNSRNIATLCNDDAVLKDIKNVLVKFDFEAGHLTHKRVTEELQKAHNFSQVKSKAGLMGAKKRWHTHNDKNGTAINDKNGTAIAKKSKVKVSKVKVRKEKEKEKEKHIFNISSGLSKLIKTWEELFPDRQLNPTQQLAAGRHLSEILNTASLSVNLDDILGAVENFKAVHKCRYCEGKFRYNHNLPRFLMKIVSGSTTYLPAYFNIENFMTDEQREKYQKKKQYEQKKRNTGNSMVL